MTKILAGQECCENCPLAGKIQAACGCCSNIIYLHAIEQQNLCMCKAKFFPDFDETCFTPWRGWEKCFTTCPARVNEEVRND